MDLIEDAAFLALLSMIKICPDVIFTYEYIQENFGLTMYGVRKMLDKYGLGRQVISREISEQERKTLNGLRLFEGSNKEYYRSSDGEFHLYHPKSLNMVYKLYYSI